MAEFDYGTSAVVTTEGHKVGPQQVRCSIIISKNPPKVTYIDGEIAGGRNTTIRRIVRSAPNTSVKRAARDFMGLSVPCLDMTGFATL